MTVSISGTGGLTFNDNSVQDTAATGFGFKNRIINGAMVIDQRNAGASYTQVNGAYNLDRWSGNSFDGGAATSKFSVQQSSTAPTGFSTSMLVTSLAATADGASNIFNIEQRIEGFNSADLGFGTASAKTITISFWVRSSLTGTFGGAIKNSARNRAYPFTYTISSANTFEYKAVTIAGDTTGTWVGSTNGTGLWLSFGLGVGSTYSGTAGAWGAGDLFSATGATSVVGTSGATFFITGVQLEKGSTATSFDYRPFGTELALCQRYYYNSYPANSSGTGHTFAGGVIPSAASIAECCVGFPVTMRAAPTVTFPNGLGQSGVAVAAASTASQIDTTGFLRGNKTSGNFTASSSLVTGGFIASSEL